MSEVAEQLKSQIEQLPVEDRAELAHFLLQSLEPDEQGAREAWKKEIKRRIAEVDSGEAEFYPADEVFAEMREKHS